jgi:hypothetical protein
LVLPPGKDAVFVQGYDTKAIGFGAFTVQCDIRQPSDPKVVAI